MSAVTLETLTAQLDAIIQQFDDLAESSIGSNDQYGTALKLDALVCEAKRKATLISIAVDHGLQAAMLFKLSDGAIDPRGAA